MSISIQAQGMFSLRPEENQNGILGGKKTVFAGNLNLADDPIAQKRKEAQEKAFRLVKNAWENDQEVEKSVNSMKDHYYGLQAENAEYGKELDDVHEDEKVLQELYGVAEDSEEQQDLELLKKRQDYYNRVGEAPTEEEYKRLAEIDKKGLTEYQERALGLNSRAAAVKKKINDNKEMMQVDVANVKSILLEKLKSDPMVDAQKAAEEINQAANDEIIGMLKQDAMDYIDEKLEEAKEQADKKAEEKEEKEKLQEEIELKRAVQEAMIEQTKEAVDRAKAKEQQQDAPDMDFDEMLDLTRNNPAASDVQQGLADIKNSMKLVEADLKGIKVDEEV